MGYKNKTNKEYQYEYYAKNKVKRNQYNKEYYLANYDYIRVYQYLYHRNKKYERNKNENNCYSSKRNYNIYIRKLKNTIEINF